MWVLSKDNKVAVEWNGMWPNHMALRNLAHWSKTDINNCHKWQLRGCHLQLVCNHPSQLHAKMNTDHTLATAPVHHPLHLQCLCPQATATPSSLTSTGRRCHLLYCIDLGPGIHFTESLACHFIFHSTSVASPSSKLLLNFTEPLHHSEPNSGRNFQTLELTCRERVIICTVIGAKAEEV